MRGRTKLISVAAALSILLTVSMVFASGIIDVSRFELPNVLPTDEPASPGTKVEVEPSKIIKDYLKDPTYQKGNKFTVIVNISDVTDLYTWQINITWSRNPTLNKAILNMSRFIANEFLARSPSPTSSETLSLVINSTNNVVGSSVGTETILGNVGGVTSLVGGDLVTIEFLIVGYGSTDIFIRSTGTLPTTLLNSAGGTITFTETHGYFRNKLKGDVNMDGAVDFLNDFTLFKASYLKVPPDPAYNREADTDYNGAVDFLTDFTDFKANYLKSVTV